MKNYIVYSLRDESAAMVRRFDTQEEAVAWVDKNITEWRDMGSFGRAYKVCYNGSRSEEVYRAVSVPQLREVAS